MKRKIKNLKKFKNCKNFGNLKIEKILKIERNFKLLTKRTRKLTKCQTIQTLSHSTSYAAQNSRNLYK